MWLGRPKLLLGKWKGFGFGVCSLRKSLCKKKVVVVVNSGV